MAGGIRQKIQITGVQYEILTEEVGHSVAADKARSADWSGDMDGGARTVTQNCVEAECYQRNGSWHLFYEEYLEGYPEKFRTHIKCRPNYLEMTRRGRMGTCLIFEPGKTHRTEYVTPFGALLLDVVAKSVRMEAAADGISCPDIKISYTLENEGQSLGEYELKIESTKQ